MREFSSENRDFETEIPSDVKVQTRIEQLPGGREFAVEVIGDPEGCKKFNEEQGNNDFGYEQTCGFCACVNSMRMLGKESNENDLVWHAVPRGLCVIDSKEEKDNGGTTFRQREQILKDFGVPTHSGYDATIEDVAGWSQEGRAVILRVNSGYLWEKVAGSKNTDYGELQPDHAIVVTAVGRDPVTKETVGFYINDSNRDASGELMSGRFVDVNTIRKCWEGIGGFYNVTDITRRDVYNV